MSLIQMSMAWKLQGITPTQKLVLISLADNANDLGDECYPSIAQIGFKTCLSERAIRGAIRALEEAGIVRTVQRAGTSPRYRLTIENPVTPASPAPLKGKPTPAANAPQGGGKCPPAADAPGAADAPPGGSTCRGGGQEMPGGGASAAPKPSLNHHLTVTEPPTRARDKPPDLPEWLSPQAWAMWDRYRAGKGWTADAKRLSLRTLARLRESGHDPTSLIELAIERGWRGIYPPKDDRQRRDVVQANDEAGRLWLHGVEDDGRTIDG